jgi:hypothetical protein
MSQDPTNPMPPTTVQIDELLDNHKVEFGECLRWASSDAGQEARIENPAGFANVRAHAAAHQMMLMKQAILMQPPPQELGGKSKPPKQAEPKQPEPQL